MKETTVRFLIQIFLTSAVISIALWPFWGPKAMVVAVPVWGFFEIISRLSRRTQLVCRFCGFDPVLFMVDRRKAKKTVQDFWVHRFAKKGIEIPKPEETAGKHLPRIRFPFPNAKKEPEISSLILTGADPGSYPNEDVRQ